MPENLPDSLATLQAELDALRREQHAFHAALAHDLRAGVRHVLSFAQLVEEDAAPVLAAQTLGFLHHIRDAALRMGTLLDSVQALAQVDSAALHWQTVPLQDMVNDVAGHVVRELAQATPPPSPITWHIAPDLPAVWVDAALLRQALTAVLGNAVKFSAGRDPATIEVRATLDAAAHTVVLQVQDHGIGYNPAHQAQLFMPLQRLHNAAQGAGVGMGLALTRKIVQRLGGSIALHGAVDAGCTVTLVLRQAP